MAWLHQLLQQGSAADVTATFSLIPDYVLGDALTWLTFVVGR
jgi:hypothetical protein